MGAVSVLRPPSAPTWLTLILLLTLTFASPPSHLQVPFPPPSLPNLLHNVDDIAPAFKNATEAALTKAKAILANYTTALHIISIPTGLAVSFFGYFLLSPVLFLSGFTLGGTASFIATSALLGHSTPAAVYISIAAMLLGGAMLAFLALRALSFGMFAVGAALGVILASALKASLIAKAYPKDPQLAFIIAAAVCGLVFGLIAIFLQKQMLILSTAYAGSVAAVFGIGHFAGHFPTAEELEAAEKGNLDNWVLFYVLLALGIGTAGMFFQFWLGRGKTMPTHAPHDRRRRRRRVRRVESDDWSDLDDWEDHVYVERAPPPRRKYEQVDRPDIQTPISPTQHAGFKEEQPPGYPAYSHPQTGNIRYAAGAGSEDSCVRDADTVHPAPFYGQEPVDFTVDAENSPEPRRTKAQVPPPDPVRPLEANAKPDFIPEHCELEPELWSELDNEESLPYTKLALNDTPEERAVSNPIESIEIGDGTFVLGHHKLDNILMDSSCEGTAAKG